MTEQDIDHSDPPLALITGGSSGIGRELAQLLAEDGYDLIINGVSDSVYDAAEELRETDASVTPVQADLTTQEGVASVVGAVERSGRPLDALILNAGIATGGDFFDISLEQHLKLINLNIISTVRLCHALLPDMIENEGGRVLFVSSISAWTPTPYEGVYGPSKAFMSSFGHGLREELKETGISLTILHPGAVATEFHSRADMDDTEFGDNSWKNDPELVASQGYEALKEGVNSVIGGDEETKEEGREMKNLSEEEKAKRHAEMTRPGSAEQKD